MVDPRLGKKSSLLGTRGCRTIFHVSYLRDLLVEPSPIFDPRLGHRVRAFDSTEGFIELPKTDNGNVKLKGGCTQSGLHICQGINTLSREHWSSKSNTV